MSKTPSPHFQMESWAIAFSISSLINFGIVYIWSIYQSLDKKVWFTTPFFSSQRELHSARFIFFSTMTYFVPIEVMRDRFTKMYPKYLNANLWPYHLPIRLGFIFELEASYSFKINCVLVRQVISFKKKAGVISKIYCLISWPPICSPLILVSTISVRENGRYLSHSTI